MKRSRRLGIRFVWLSAIVPVTFVGALGASEFFLEAPATASRTFHPTPVSSEAPRPVKETPALTAEITPSAPARPRTPSARIAAATVTARSRTATPRDRATALTYLRNRTPEEARAIAFDLVDDDLELGAVALETIAACSSNEAPRAEAAQRILAVASHTSEPDRALACCRAFDALNGPHLAPQDLRRALDCASLPEARVVILRQLALLFPHAEAARALEDALARDASVVVREAALELSVAAGLAVDWRALAPGIAGAPSLRRAATRVLARVPGSDADTVLACSYSAAQDRRELKALAALLAGRTPESRALLASVARTSPAHATVAREALDAPTSQAALGGK